MTISVADGITLPPSEEPSPTPGGVPGYNPSSLLDGGDVIWLGGYDFLITAARYQILGVEYNSPDTEVTLSTAHATLDRIDVFAVNNVGAAVVVEGTNAADPVKPDVDPTSQLELTFTYIEAATGPTGITNTIVYSGEGGDWAAADNTANINLASTNNPHSGTVCVEGTSVVDGNYFEFTAGAAFDLNTYNNIVLYIRLKATMAAGKAFVFRWFNATTARGVQVVLSDGQLNFNRSLVGVYQAIVIPTLLFDTGAFTVDKLRCTIQGGGGSVGFYFDDCSLQGGLVPAWETTPIGFANPMTTGGDIIYGGTDGVATRLANGVAGQALVSSGGTAAPTWKQFAQTTQTLTDAATVAWNTALGPVAKVTLGDNRTLGAPSNLIDGGTYVLRVIQDGTGSRTLAYNAVYKWPGGVAPTLSTAIGAIDIITFVSDGTNMYGCIQQAFA